MKELGEALAGLRQSDREWRRGQDALSRALKAWRAEPAVAPVLAAIKRFGKGAALERCEALAELFDPASSRAGAFARSLADSGIVGLDSHPLGQLPLAHASRDAVPALIVAGAGRATLALAVYEGEALAALPPPQTVRFLPVESWVRVVTGAAQAERAFLDEEGSALRRVSVTVGAGDIIHRHGPREALIVHTVDGAMVVLRLERRIEGVPWVREHRLADGALVHQASATRQGSRNELVLAVLASMGETDGTVGRDVEDTISWPA